MIPELNGAIDQLNAEATEAVYFDTKSMEAEKMVEVIKQLDAKLVSFKQFEETSNRYNDWQNKLYVPTTNFDNLEECRTQLVNRHLMWHSLEEWSSMTEVWMRSNFG